MLISDPNPTRTGAHPRDFNDLGPYPASRRQSARARLLLVTSLAMECTRRERTAPWGAERYMGALAGCRSTRRCARAVGPAPSQPGRIPSARTQNPGQVQPGKTSAYIPFEARSGHRRDHLAPRCTLDLSTVVSPFPARAFIRHPTWIRIRLARFLTGIRLGFVAWGRTRFWPLGTVWNTFFSGIGNSGHDGASCRESFSGMREMHHPRFWNRAQRCSAWVYALFLILYQSVSGE
jgi:hypothetical protein